ncbi:hypothetical protein GG344DRAFT_83816 [Lentinula edodes]|nr:hypothetical protein GG344DRAFT_83816 [Lentinula edodes]
MAYLRNPFSSVNTSSPPSLSPVVSPASLFATPSPVIQELNSANERIWLTIGRLAEQMGDLNHALSAYEHALRHNPSSFGLTRIADISKIRNVYPKLCWQYDPNGPEIAIQYLTKSLETDPHDAQSWYLLGRAYMACRKYHKASEAYQQAVYRDSENAIFWCSIGVLYFKNDLFSDASDAYHKAFCIDPYISEIWSGFGTLYEKSNRLFECISAYTRASELDPSNIVISDRIQLLKNVQTTGGQLPAALDPQDVHLESYANTIIPPPCVTSPPSGPQGMSHASSSRETLSSSTRLLLNQSPADGANCDLLPSSPTFHASTMAASRV